KQQPISDFQTHVIIPPARTVYYAQHFGGLCVSYFTLYRQVCPVESCEIGARIPPAKGGISCANIILYQWVTDALPFSRGSRNPCVSTFRNTSEIVAVLGPPP